MISALALAFLLTADKPVPPEAKARSCEEVCQSMAVRCKRICDHPSAQEKMPECPKKCEEASARCANTCNKRHNKPPPSAP